MELEVVQQAQIPHSPSFAYSYLPFRASTVLRY